MTRHGSVSGPEVAVIVPTRNRARFLSRLLGQLVSLPGPTTYEVIVVDEGSSDGTPDLLARYQRDHGVRTIRHDEPCGLPAARNVGLAASTAEAVAWIDDDDLTAPDRLPRQLSALRAGFRWSCAGRVDVDDSLSVIGHERCPQAPVLPSLLMFNVLPAAAQGLLVERSLADEVGGFNESLRAAEDWEFCIRLALVAEPHLLDEPLVGYRTGALSMSTDTERMVDAVRSVERLHASTYERFGCGVDWARVHDSLIAADLLERGRGAFWRASQAFVAGPRWHRAVRCGLIALAPRWFAARAAARRRAQVPDEWSAAARTWLSAVEAV